MIEDIESLQSSVTTCMKDAVNLDSLRAVEGWNGLEAMAERIEIARLELDQPCIHKQKWSGRGLVTIHLFNWEDKRFGTLGLYLHASGHIDTAQGPVADALLISPYEL